MIEMDEILDANLTDDAKALIRTEGFQLTREVTGLKVSNREQYTKACELGIANQNILKKLEALRKALLAPIDIEKKRIMEAFKKASSLFEANDETIRGAIGVYQEKVKTDGIRNINTELGRATVQERKDWEVMDIKKIPSEYWILDESKIGKVVRAGGEIPGIKVKVVKTTAFCAA